MCGIVGYSGKAGSLDVLLEGLHKLEYRGYDSAGVALSYPDGIRVAKAQGRLSALEEKLAGLHRPDSGCGIGHTRWATHGAPSDVNSHPHSAARVSLVHNGIIENYAQLREYLVRKGYEFCSETDSEVLVKLMDHNYQGDPLDAMRRTLAQVRGSYGLAILFRDRPGVIYGARKDSPLIVGCGEGENFLASDIPALLRHTRTYIALEEGDMVELKPDSIRLFDRLGQPVARPRMEAQWEMEAAEKGGYPHFMLKEIHEQQAALQATIGPRIKNGLPDLSECGLTDEYLKGLTGIHIVGCGTAMHAGMVGRTAIEKMARLPAFTQMPVNSVTVTPFCIRGIWWSSSARAAKRWIRWRP